MAYIYAASTQRATSVTSSIVCSFTSPTDRNLLLGKGNILDIYNCSSEELTLVKSLPLYGKISKIDKYRPSGSTKDYVFILTAKLQFCVLSWDASANQPTVRVTGNMNDRSGKAIENGNMLFVDPDNRMIGVMVFEGQIKIIPIDSSGFKEMFDVRLDCLRPIDIKFVHGCGKPTISVLFEDDKNMRHMRSYTVEVKDKELIPTAWQQAQLDDGAIFVIPVPMPLGGIVIVGENTIAYMNHWRVSGSGNPSETAQNIQYAALPQTQMTAWGAIDTSTSIEGTPLRYLLSDFMGNIYILVLCTDNGRVSALVVNQLGKTNIPETINYLDNGVVYIGCTFGDSQLIRLRKDSSNHSSLDGNGCVDILETHTNLGPIVDMCVVTGDRQGQSQIVTCSGAFNNGSLRIIRSGIGMNEEAVVEVSGLKDSWAIKARDDHVFDKYLVQCYIGESRILAIENEEMGEVESLGGFSSERTLFCSNMTGNLMVQVTARSVRLLDLTNDFNLKHEFIPDKSIILSHGNHEDLILALTGGEVMSLRLNDTRNGLNVISKISLDNDVACISAQRRVSKLSEDAMVIDDAQDEGSSSQSHSALVVIGLWTENTVRIYTTSFHEIMKVSLSSQDTQVRDASIEYLGKNLYLLLGLGDGTLITCALEQSASDVLTISSRRKISIGTTPLSFTGFYNNNSYCVFISCDRPTVLYQSYDKMLFSVVNIQETYKMTTFNSELFPQALCLISERGFIIGNIDSIQKVHIRTKSTNGHPRRIVHNATFGVYGVIVERTGVFEYGEETRAFIVFYDEISMEVIYEYMLQSFEMGMCITTTSLSSKTTTNTNESSVGSFGQKELKDEYFVVGTAYSLDSDREQTNGRLLMFVVSNNSSNNVKMNDNNLAFSTTGNKVVVYLTEKEVKASVQSLAPCVGKIAACVGSKVIIYSLKSEVSDGQHFLSTEATITQDAAHYGYVLALEVKSHGEFLLVGDLLRSVTLLRYSPATNELTEIARDFNANMMRSIAILGGDPLEYFLGADDSMNLFTVKRNLDAPTSEEEAKLVLHGEFHIGDQINCIKVGAISGDYDDSGAHSDLVGAGSGEDKMDATGNKVLHKEAKNNVTGMPYRTPSYVFGTISGSIGAIILLSKDVFTFFQCLERSLKSVIGSLGGLSHSDFRNFSNERRTSAYKYFIDGDLVETFMDISRDSQEVVVRQLNDEYNSMQMSTAATSAVGGASGSTSGASGNISTLASMTAMLNAQETTFTVEEVLRRVEDISRLH